MKRFAGTKVNPVLVKKRVSYLHVIYLTCLFLSLFLFVFIWVYGILPEKHYFVSVDMVLIGMIAQAALFLIGVWFYIYTDKLRIVFKIDLYNPQKKGKTKIAKLRSYRKHFKKRLTRFIIFEFFLVAFFVTCLIVTRLVGCYIDSTFLDFNSVLSSELVFLIYTIVLLIAMAINIMYVNYLIQLSSKIFRKKPVQQPINFDNYDYD